MQESDRAEILTNKILLTTEYTIQQDLYTNYYVNNMDVKRVGGL